MSIAESSYTGAMLSRLCRSCQNASAMVRKNLTYLHIADLELREGVDVHCGIAVRGSHVVDTLVVVVRRECAWFRSVESVRVVAGCGALRICLIFQSRRLRVTKLILMHWRSDRMHMNACSD